LSETGRFQYSHDAERIHGISTELAEAEGITAEVLEKFNVALGKAKFIVGQNLVLMSILWDGIASYGRGFSHGIHASFRYLYRVTAKLFCTWVVGGRI
jgi:hypothetical protein